MKSLGCESETIQLCVKVFQLQIQLETRLTYTQRNDFNFPKPMNLLMMIFNLPSKQTCLNDIRLNCLYRLEDGIWNITR